MKALISTDGQETTVVMRAENVFEQSIIDSLIAYSVETSISKPTEVDADDSRMVLELRMRESKKPRALALEAK